MGLKKDEVELWEDGSRVDGSKGSYEWWYYDSLTPTHVYEKSKTFKVREARLELKKSFKFDRIKSQQQLDK